MTSRTDPQAGSHPDDARVQEPRPTSIIAPAATLRTWLDEHRNVLDPAATGLDTGSRHLVQEVLDRKPLTGDHADLLEWGTGIPARVWLDHEHNYRAGLAAGLTDAGQ